MSSSTLTPATKQSARRQVTTIAHAAFIPTGVVTVLLGPLLPTLSSRWALNDAQAGYLFTAQFAGSTIGVALSGWLTIVAGFWLPIVAGLLLMAVGTSSLLATAWPLGLACTICYGIGLGLTIPAANLLVAHVNRGRSAGALNLLNFSWSVGAAACPFVVAAFQRVHRLPLFLYCLGGVLVLISVLISTTASFAATAQKPLVQQDDSPAPVNLWRNRNLLFLGLLFFLYVGMENAIGGWSASYAKRVSLQPGTFWLMTPSFFYGALLLGRGLAPLFLRYIPELKMAQAGSLIGCIGTAALLSSHSATRIAGSIVVTGLGLSAVYPITIAVLSHNFASAASRLGALMFSLANIGGATLPWLVGYFSKHFGSLKVGLAVPLVAGIVMFAVYSRLSVEDRPKAMGTSP